MLEHVERTLQVIGILSLYIDLVEHRSCRSNVELVIINAQNLAIIYVWKSNTFEDIFLIDIAAAHIWSQTAVANLAIEIYLWSIQGLLKDTLIFDFFKALM